jgi:F5/8 type C domain
LDEELRPAIDRLVTSGGRMRIDGDCASGAMAITLEQPGVRFGILEIRGTATVPAADAETIATLESRGWTDPNVTHRLGREVRLHPEGTLDGRPATYTRRWRVPPALASEVADDVRASLGIVGRVEFQPLPTRERPPTEARPAVRPPTEERDLDEPGEPRVAGRTMPTPVRAVLAVAVVGVIGFAWVGMIRGAPRLLGGSSSSVAGLESSTQPTEVPTSLAPTAEAPTGAVPTPATAIPAEEAMSSHLVGVSSEDPTGSAPAAIDGDPVTAWHAAFGVPQWIEIALDAPSTVKEVRLLIAQAEDGPSRHMIQVAVTGQALQVVGVVDQQTADGDSIVFRPDSPIANVERIRIETMASPSNVGWYEVIVH